MPGSIGNTNAAKAKVIRDQINYVLNNYKSSKVEQGQALRAICTNIVEKAIEETDMPSINVLFDRLEGKPAQAIVGDPDQPLSITICKMITEDKG